ncbi:uncharacterized protein MONOS_17075 [Monocercomonoides exilis]|uniref:uncharacterized protein n=1 Tax=Monocercomonoides exilis TaxID=2049356 RepID=UPI00355AA82A|nr:hypothetical protein MONOS_17075 [Monocercomonoides exilis]
MLKHRLRQFVVILFLIAVVFLITIIYELIVIVIDNEAFPDDEKEKCFADEEKCRPAIIRSVFLCLLEEALAPFVFLASLAVITCKDPEESQANSKTTTQTAGGGKSRYYQYV